MSFDFNDTIVKFPREGFLLVTRLTKLMRNDGVTESLRTKYFRHLMVEEVHLLTFEGTV